MKRQFDEGERQIVRLPTMAFPELPGRVVRELQRRGCRIPQTAFTRKPHNVIKGAFIRPGQTDWAVLCSVKGVSSILVFRNGSEENPAALAPAEDRNYMQSGANGASAYSRKISAAGRDFIMGHFQAYGGPKPPPIEHLGIDDAFLEKAPVTWYFHKGEWLRLTGAD